MKSFLQYNLAAVPSESTFYDTKLKNKGHGSMTDLVAGYNKYNLLQWKNCQFKKKKKKGWGFR